MKLAVCIQCHRVSESLKYTVMQLSKSSNIRILIHVDGKSDISEFEAINWSKNVTLIKKRICVHWGSISQVYATLSLMNALNGFKYDYFSLISGDDVLTKDAFCFVDFLKRNKGAEYIGVQFDKEGFICPEERVKYVYPTYFFKKNSNFFIKIKKKIFKALAGNYLCFNSDFSSLPKLYKGSNWFTITKEAVDYIILFLEKNDGFLKAFESSFCCDELIFQTILMNSHFKDKIHGLGVLDDNLASLRYIDWVSGPCYPKLLDESDLPKIFKEPVFFARKFSENVTVQMLDYYFGC